MKNCWILVAHRAGARIFAMEGKTRNLKVVHRFENLDGRLKDGELDSDRPGRTASSVSDHRHGLSAPTPSHETVADDFSRLLNRALDNGRAEKTYEELIVVAAPQFLGQLRSSMSHETAAFLTQSFDLNLGTLSDEEVAERLRPLLSLEPPHEFASILTTATAESDGSESKENDASAELMKVQFNTDRNIEGHERLALAVETMLRKELAHFSSRITRVEVYLSDVNGTKGGATDKRCLLEARLAGIRPISVSHEESTPWQAVKGAAGKMKHSLETVLGKLERRAG